MAEAALVKEAVDKTTATTGLPQQTDSPAQNLSDGAPAQTAPNSDAASQRHWLFRASAAIASRILSVPMLTVICTAIAGPLVVQRISANSERAKLQNELIQKVLTATEAAHFDNPSEIMRVGFIAHMVSENSTIFGIKLDGAEARLEALIQSLNSSKIGALDQQVKAAQETIANVQQQKRTAEQKKEEADATIAELKSRLAKARTEERESIQIAIRNSEQLRDSYEAQIKASQESTRRLQSDIEGYQTKLKQATADLEAKVKSTDQLTQELNKYKDLSKDQASTVSELRAALGKATASLSQLSQVQDDLAQAKALVANQQQKLNQSESRVKFLEQQVSAAKDCSKNPPKDPPNTTIGSGNPG